MATNQNWRTTVETWVNKLPRGVHCVRISSAQRTDVLAEQPVSDEREYLSEAICDTLEGVHSSNDARARYILRALRPDGDVLVNISVQLPKPMDDIEPAKSEVLAMAQLMQKSNSDLMLSIERQNKIMVDMLGQHATAARTTLEHVVKVNENLANLNRDLLEENQGLRKNAVEAQGMVETALNASDALQGQLDANAQKDSRIAKLLEPMVEKLAMKFAEAKDPAKKLANGATKKKPVDSDDTTQDN